MGKMVHQTAHSAVPICKFNFNAANEAISFP
jgi:hypothetical protein